MSQLRVTALVALVLLAGMASRAQVTTGTISGTVVDNTGAVLPGVTIVILNEDTGVSRTAVADAGGRYTAPSLTLGSYRLTASLQGFQTAIRTGILLTLGREAIVNLELSVGAITQTVEVAGEAPLVEATGATVGSVVDQRTIRDLPLNGRDLTELILLNPGVSQATFAGSDNAYSGFGKKISISGTRAEDNAYFLDGTYINDYARHIPAGPSGALMGAETVREFEVLTNSYSARYGRALGGVFNAVSQSGNNVWHSSIYEYLRNSALDARNFFDRKQRPDEPRLPPFRRNQFGGTVSGPVVRDRAFVFAAYEGLRDALTSTQYNVVPDLPSRQGNLPGGRRIVVSPVIARFLALPIFPAPTPGGLGFPGDGTAQYIFQPKQPASENFGQGRFDYQISNADSIFARFTGSSASLSKVVNYPVFEQVLGMTTRLLTVSDTHIFSPRALSTFRFSFNRVEPSDQGIYPKVPAELLSVPGQPPPSLAPGSGITSWSGYPRPLDYWQTNRINVQQDSNLTLGPHSLEYGGMLEGLRFGMSNPNRPFGDWTFASLEQFLLGSPRQYRGTPPQYGTSVRNWRQWFFALYIQDNWKVTSKLTLNLGVRWEPYTTPREADNLIANLRHFTDSQTTVGSPYWLNRSWGDVGPRFGFAWSPFASGTTSIRGGFGISFEPNDSLYYYTNTTRIVPLLPEFTLVNPKYFPDALKEIANAEVPNGTANAIDYENFRSTRALQYNLTVEQQFGKSTVMSLGYTGNRGTHLVSNADYNAPLAQFNGTSLEVPANATLRNRNFQSIFYNGSNADSWYNGMTVSIRRRYSAGFQAQLSYTFSKVISTSDNYSALDRSGSGPGTRYAHDLRRDKGLSGYHVANKLSVNYVYDLPFGRDRSGIAGALAAGWELTGIVSLQSGQPFTIGNAAGATPTQLSNIGYARYPNVDTTFSSDKVIQGGPNQYFNPLAFYLPNGNFELGNIGRNTLIGPGLAKWDAGIHRDFRITERTHLQFRGEFFNILNRANFGKPSSNVFTSNRQRLGSAGLITSTVSTARQIQFGLKLVF